MRGLLIDHNIVGHGRIIQRILEGPIWAEMWHSLQLPVLTFQDIGLAETAKDSEVWRLRQSNQWILLTANRNKEDAESLEAVLQRDNHARALPVMTLADTDSVRCNKDYAERIAEKLLTYLLEIDNLRGTGRLYLP